MFALLSKSWLSHPVTAACQRFAGHCGGNMIMVVALLAPILIGAAGGGIDLGLYLKHQYALQSAADSAALAAAREGALSGWTINSAKSVVSAYVKANTGNALDGKVTFEVAVDQALRQVTVTVDQDFVPYFVLGYFTPTPQIRVIASAQASNASSICVIGLSNKDDATVSLENNAVLTAPKCAVYSNSVTPNGLMVTNNAILSAQLSCSVGGYAGSTKNFAVRPLTDCPAVTDPLASRPEPTVGACKYKNVIYKNYSGTLEPGVYCGGLEITSSSNIMLKPGIYIFKDGPLIVGSSSVVTGTGVGLFFTGTNAYFDFQSDAAVELEAPINGEMAGLIASQAKNSTYQTFTITSNSTRKLLGTIYLPKGTFSVQANNKVADQSAYTCIVAYRLLLAKGPNLVLNANYSDTPVPVPAGIGPGSASVRLVR